MRKQLFDTPSRSAHHLSEQPISLHILYGLKFAHGACLRYQSKANHHVLRMRNESSQLQWHLPLIIVGHHFRKHELPPESAAV